MNLYRIILNRLKKQKTKFDLLKEKDIIWCKRYETEDEKANILKGHREGPYIVLKKTKNKAYCLYCTSSKKDNLIDDAYYPLDRKKYYFEKNSFVSFYEVVIIHENRFIKKLRTLDDYDFEKIKKILNVKTNNKTILKNYFKTRKLKYEIGINDIIKYKNELFYIYDMNDKEYNCYKIYIKKNSKNPIVINGVIYSFDFLQKANIKYKSKIKLIGTLTSDLSNIEKIKDRFIINDTIMKNKITTRGSIILINNKMYYIYGEYKDNWLTFEIFGSKKINSHELIINKGRYYTFFNRRNILKDSTYKLKRVASATEIDEIKALYDNLKHRRKVKEKNKQNNSIVHKKVVKKCVIVNEETEEKYLVIKRDSNTITCVTYPNISKPKKIVLCKKDKLLIYEELTDLEYQNILIKIDNIVNRV